MKDGLGPEKPKARNPACELIKVKRSVEKKTGFRGLVVNGLMGKKEKKMPEMISRL